MSNRNVAYIWGESLIEHCDRLPAVEKRASLVHNLIAAYGLLNHLKVVRSAPATYNDLKLFHSELYLDHLKKFDQMEDQDDYVPDAEDEEYGLDLTSIIYSLKWNALVMMPLQYSFLNLSYIKEMVIKATELKEHSRPLRPKMRYDCVPFPGMYNTVATIAGSSITAAKCLLLNIADVAINWCGGWHHAHRFGAEGFCYVNDIVIAIEKLRLKYPEVLYIDMDVHHGNGVADAYNLSKSVFTLSFHKYEPGFYPGTGSVEDVGTLTGKGYTCNVPLQAFYSDESFEYVFDNVFTMVYACFMPDAIVVQCGADALAHDPLGEAGLSLKGYCSCIQKVLDKGKPTLLLGGGGYKHPNVAKLWTTITALVTGIELEEAIPEHHFWTQYRPDYTLTVSPLLSKDANTKEYITHIITVVKENLRKYLLPEDIGEPLVKKRKSDDSESKQKNMPMKCKLDLKDTMHVQCEGSGSSIDVYEFSE